MRVVRNVLLAPVWLGLFVVLLRHGKPRWDYALVYLCWVVRGGDE